MKRSEINLLVRHARKCFEEHDWALPPQPRWDVTDFGLGEWRKSGLVLVNLAEEPEYCEKLMYAKRGMTTPAHCHKIKKEDIICRWGTLRLRFWADHPGKEAIQDLVLQVNGEPQRVAPGAFIHLGAGERATILPGVYHEFEPISDECIIGEVSTANDDQNDNFFVNPDVGRFARIDEDEPADTKLIGD